VCHLLKESSGNILGFKIPGDIAEKQKEQICNIMDTQIKESGKISILLVVETDETVDPESLLFNLNFVLAYSDRIDRMAIVRTKAWQETWIGLFGVFSHIRTGYFDASEIREAWKWIRS
jgi:SpoIIAA-like